MKKVNWKPVVPCNLSEDCFWLEQPVQSQMDDVYHGLKEKFSFPNKHGGKQNIKPSNILHVLDSNSAQNLLILLRVAMKGVHYEQIKEYILACDTSKLSVHFNEGLIKCIPEHDGMKRLNDLKAKVQLSEAEDFVASLFDIERLPSRLKCLNFKIDYSDMVANLEPDIEVYLAACKEVIESSKFKKVLSVILQIGNFMNVEQSANKTQALGFELNVLPQLNDVWTIDKKSTLLQYIVDIIASKHPACSNFGTEITHVEKAARLNASHIEEIIQSISDSSEVLKKELQVKNVHRLIEDKFVKVMSSFSLECCDRINHLTDLFEQLQQIYKKVGDVYAFNAKSYPMERLFLDIHQFQSSFEKTYTDIYGFSENIDHEEVKNQQEPDAYTCVVKLTRLTEEGSLLIHSS